MTTGPVTLAPVPQAPATPAAPPARTPRSAYGTPKASNPPNTFGILRFDDVPAAPAGTSDTPTILPLPAVPTSSK